MLKKALNEGKIKKVQISADSPIFYHLVFANDVLLFDKANLREVHQMMTILNKFSNTLV